MITSCWKKNTNTSAQLLVYKKQSAGRNSSGRKIVFIKEVDQSTCIKELISTSYERIDHDPSHFS